MRGRERERERERDTGSEGRARPCINIILSNTMETLHYIVLQTHKHVCTSNSYRIMSHDSRL